MTSHHLLRTVPGDEEQSSASTLVAVGAKDVCCTLPCGKALLSNVSCFVKAHNLMAILGPSGAGKSSLLDILAGRKKLGAVSGDLRAYCLGGSCVDLRSPGAANHRIGKFGELCAYVTQGNCHISNLTVYETLWFALRLRKESADVSEIQHVLSLLGLQPIQNERIGDPLTRGISGGEVRAMPMHRKVHVEGIKAHCCAS